MDLMILFVLKSVLIAGATLGLLRLLRNRSAADRSSVASLGLAALMLMPAASLVLPPLQIAVPAFAAHPVPSLADPTSIAAPTSALDWQVLAYTLPMLVLLSLTLLAIARLYALRDRANVLVEPNWLNALARAQRRMGFSQGTALLTSNELSSPISWGVVRPVIVLNEEAVAAHDKAEAIIAHELAHVARLDWARLLIARVVTALYWFNPLVWMLAREAHQLREEAADDAVLAANFTDTEYARLLISIARHECNGTLLGAHGVAPGRNSLARRVSRVLDAGSARGPVARGFAAAIGFGAIACAAPLAALSLTSKPVEASEARIAPAPRTVSVAIPRSVNNVLATSKPAVVIARQEAAVAVKTAPANAVPNPRPDPNADLDADDAAREGDLAQRSMAMRAVFVTTDNAAVVRAAAIGSLDSGTLEQLRAVSWIARYVTEATAAGCRIDDRDGIVEIRAVGVTPDFIRAITLIFKQAAPPQAPGLEPQEDPAPGIEPRSSPRPDSNLTARHGLSHAVPISRSA